MPIWRGKHRSKPDAGRSDPAHQPETSLDELLAGDTSRPPAEPGPNGLTAEQHAAADLGGVASNATTALEAVADNAAAPHARPPWYRRARLAFRRWRRTRPFWGGLLCLLGGAAMAYGPFTVIRFILLSGTVVWAGMLIGLLVCAMGLFLWFTPQFRQMAGILAALFSVVSLITSNFGGFLVGLFLGVLGGAMGFAWTPLPAQASNVGAEPVTPAEPQEPLGQEAAGHQEEVQADAESAEPPTEAADGVPTDLSAR